ncbi:MAG TPA: hypothetical protein VED40_06925 [Azospirillaceae bacterium]|nr:hypothetical protein [Azospirillaceae bacterium]
MPTFDFSTKVIPEDQKIWAMHAGRRKRQIRNFLGHKVVFLEIPGFAPDADTVQSAEKIRQHLRLSREIYNYLLKGGALPPSRVAAAYDDQPDPKDKGLNSALGNVISIYREAKVGDLILVPGKDQYSPVYAGEIASPFAVADQSEFSPFSGEVVPFRRVNWLNIAVERRHFSSAVAKRLENPHAIIDIRSNDSSGSIAEEIYKKVYVNYVTEHESKVAFFGKKYDSKDPTGIVDTTNLIKYFCAAYVAIERGEIDRFAGLDFMVATRTYYPSEIVRDFSFNFNSPGKIDLKTLQKAALFVGLCIAATTALTPAEVGAPVMVTNLGAAVADGPLHDCAQMYNRLLTSIGADGFEKIKIVCAEAEASIGLDTQIKRTQ